MASVEVAASAARIRSADEPDDEINPRDDFAAHLGEIEILHRRIADEMGAGIGEGRHADHAPHEDQPRPAEYLHGRRHRQRQEDQAEGPQPQRMHHLLGRLGHEVAVQKLNERRQRRQDEPREHHRLERGEAPGAVAPGRLPNGKSAGGKSLGHHAGPSRSHVLYVGPAPPVTGLTKSSARRAPGTQISHRTSSGTPGSFLLEWITSEDLTLATLREAVSVSVMKDWKDDRSLATHLSRKSTSPDSM